MSVKHRDKYGGCGTACMGSNNFSMNEVKSVRFTAHVAVQEGRKNLVLLD